MLLIQQHSPGVVSMGLNRADKRNAINVEMTHAIEAALIQFKYDPSVKVIVIYGVGPHFCAGMDLKDFFDSSTRSPAVLAQAKAATEHWRTRLLGDMPQTLVTAVNGFCFGAALPFLSNSQQVFAHPDAVLGLPEINFGFAPGAQILKSLAQKLSAKRLAYAALTGRPLSAQLAQQWGLVHQLVDTDPLGAALAYAKALVEDER